MNVKKSRTKRAAEPLPHPLPENLSARQAAAYLTVSPEQLKIWRDKGEGPAWSRLSERRIVYPLDSLRAFVGAGLRTA